MSFCAGNLGPVTLGRDALSAGGCAGGGLVRNLLGALVGKVVSGRFFAKIFLGGN